MDLLITGSLEECFLLPESLRVMSVAHDLSNTLGDPYAIPLQDNETRPVITSHSTKLMICRAGPIFGYEILVRFLRLADYVYLEGLWALFDKIFCASRRKTTPSQGFFDEENFFLPFSFSSLFKVKAMVHREF